MSDTTQILPGTGRWREASEGTRLSANTVLAGRWAPSVSPADCHLPTPGRISQ